MNSNQNSKPQGVMDSVVEEELCRQAFSLFDKSGSGTISKTVCTPNLYDLLSAIVYPIHFHLFLFYTHLVSTKSIKTNLVVKELLITYGYVMKDVFL